MGGISAPGMNSGRGDERDGETGCCWSPLTSRRLFVDVMTVGDDIAAAGTTMKHSCGEKVGGESLDSCEGFGSVWWPSCHTPSSGGLLQGALIEVLVSSRLTIDFLGTFSTPPTSLHGFVGLAEPGGAPGR